MIYFMNAERTANKKLNNILEMYEMYYIFMSGYPYCKYMCDGISSERKKKLIVPYHFGGNKALQALNKLRLKIHEKTDDYSKLWFPAFLDFTFPSLEEKHVFCFFDSCFMCHNKAFIKWLRKKYKFSKIIVIVVNHLGDNVELAEFYLEYFDVVFSFDKYDCDKYKFSFFDGLAPKVDLIPKESNNVFDIGFISRDKGRYKELKKLYLRLSDKGIRCLFYIISDIQPRDEVDKILLHKEYLNFEEVVKMENSCKCLLDYSCIKNGEQGLSLRVFDALSLNKLLITDNKTIYEYESYNSKYVKVINNLDDIELEKSFFSQTPNYKGVNSFYMETLLKKTDDIIN